MSQYTDDTQIMVFSTPGWLNEAVKFLSQCLEAMWTWMGREPSDSETEWLLVLGLPSSEDIPTSTLNGIIPPH